ncbi:MAG: valine--tRNA ligase [Candidatus Omnitrophica bacterium]|jgi:valyl-tRNA synthetase|nr:valine--tRNA ligase [Candidatus Omnitrophota bacterium]
MNDIPTRYDPRKTEDKWYKLWEDENLFAAKPNSDKKPFCVVIPPPNVTGILHMGHALNNTIQDILIRYHRMLGDESLWMPGTDHAGIATQNVVEKAIAKEGLKRQDLGREKFIQRVWLWREQYGSTIIHQLKKLGASCDWQRLRFTMDEEYSKSVIDVFVKLYEKGLIYRGSYIINWCPRCQTALSDEEAPHHELQSNLYYLRYPLKDNPQEFIIVATTRPETMLGDTAVAVNPKDRRYKHLVGKILILPLVKREIRIIADPMVDMEFGTGAVKVTPAHDPNDYALGKKHGLEFVNVMHPDGKMNEFAGDYQDMDRFEAREVILEDLLEQKLLEKITPHTLSAGHCYRCHTIIEPYLSKQWFVKMKPLAKPAIEAVKKGKIKFHPDRWTKVYLNWMKNIQDWCISRQIWWGHRLPVYYCKNCQQSAISKQQSAKNELTAESRKLKAEEGVIVSKIKPAKCPYCGSNEIYQDEDVLDTWFSSWLWPFATFYWPFQQSAKNELTAESNKLKAELEYFYPTSVLVTAPEIIFFWVARMIMSGFEFMGKLPFKDVYIHGTVRDIEGKKMSKSLGNIIDPLEIINKYGTDALRFSLISITAEGQDVFLSKERFEQGRNFANKIWNASRFILMNLESPQDKADLCVFFKKENLSLVNRWILSRFYSTLKAINKDLDNFKFNEAANLLYGFFWHEFCDWYLELIKPEIKTKQNQLVMYKILEKFLRVAHPFMPFISEEIWHLIRNEQASSIMLQPWPHIQEEIIDKKAEIETELLFKIISEIRNLRIAIEVKPEQRVNVSLYPHTKAIASLLEQNSALLINLAKIEKLELLKKNLRPDATITSVAEDIDIYLHFSGLLDIAAEQQKIKDKISLLEKSLNGKNSRLSNKEFMKNAPEDIIVKEKESRDKLIAEIKRLEKMQNELC